MQEEDTLMTDQQREEEAMFKHTFNFYMQGKGVTSLERYELPMILDGKLQTLRNRQQAAFPKKWNFRRSFSLSSDQSQERKGEEVFVTHT